MLDVAALHPRLQLPGSQSNYFAAAEKLRISASTILIQAFRAEQFTPYLLHNTSSGLVSVLFAAMRAGQPIALHGPQNQHYPPYLPLFTSAPPHANWRMHTHVSPLTGAIDPLADAGEGSVDGVDGLQSVHSVRIVDAAQSFATGLMPALLARADIIIAPLHKHIGLIAGLGMVWVRHGKPGLQAVHEVLRIAESGVQSMHLLTQLNLALAQAGGQLSNRAQIIIDQELCAWCGAHGLLLHGSGQGVPFACVTTTDGKPISERLRPGKWRHLDKANVARFAFYCQGYPDDAPIDCSSQFCEHIQAALL